MPPHKQKEQKRIWLMRHPGVLSEVAKEMKVSYVAAYAVLMYSKRSRECRIEIALAKRGAPGMAAYLRMKTAKRD